MIIPIRLDSQLPAGHAISYFNKSPVIYATKAPTFKATTSLLFHSNVQLNHARMSLVYSKLIALSMDASRVTFSL